MSLQPYKLIPIDVEEFMAANEYCTMVTENEFLEEIPGLNTKISVSDDQVFKLTNIPENRFGLAAMRFFRGRKHDKGYSFMMRYMAMVGVVHHLKNDKRMAPYLQTTDDDGIAFHRAIFEVAATHPLNSKHEFSRRDFLAAVKRTARRIDEDESNDAS